MKKEIKNYLNKTKNIKVKNKGIIKLKTNEYKHIKLPSLNNLEFRLKVSKGIKVKRPLQGSKKTYDGNGNIAIKTDTNGFYVGQKVCCFVYSKKKNGKIEKNFIGGKISYIPPRDNSNLTVVDNKFGLKHIVWKKEVVSKKIIDEFLKAIINNYD